LLQRPLVSAASGVDVGQQTLSHWLVLKLMMSHDVIHVLF